MKELGAIISNHKFTARELIFLILSNIVMAAWFWLS
jgi:hypothetical protein